MGRGKWSGCAMNMLALRTGDTSRIASLSLMMLVKRFDSVQEFVTEANTVLWLPSPPPAAGELGATRRETAMPPGAWSRSRLDYGAWPGDCRCRTSGR